MRDHDPGGVDRARRLRRQLSPPELKLWLELKAASDGRCPFRKQHPLGAYVLDFYAHLARLCVEVDGYAHGTEDRPQRDARRDLWLSERGITTVRVSAAQVMANAWGVAAWLLQIEAERASPPPTASRPPPPRGEA